MIAVLPALSRPGHCPVWHARDRDRLQPQPGDLIDFPVSPVYVAAYAEQGLTPALPDGHPDGAPAWEPLPLVQLDATAWAQQSERLLGLIAWANTVGQYYPPDEWHNHLPGAIESGLEPKRFRPREQPPIGAEPHRVAQSPAPAPKTYPKPAPKLEGQWRRQ